MSAKPPRRRTIRLFVSSTFSDMVAERNVLQDDVFPKLRRLCLEKRLRFQPIDLRWGVPAEAGRDNQTVRICLRELRRCQEGRPKPNFLILLGDRYGWRPLPETIPADLFAQLIDRMPPHLKSLCEWREDQEVGAKGWYRRDDNAEPAVYVLLPRGEKEAWQETVEQPLLRALEVAATEVGSKIELHGLGIGSSTTEQEIVAGALKIEDARDHVHAFFRTIEGMPDDPWPERYVDTLPDGNRDSDALARLNGLKTRLNDKLGAIDGAAPESNVHAYTVPWRDGAVQQSDLTQFGKDVLEALGNVILRQADELESHSPEEQEEAAHREFGDERRHHFVGRGDLVEQINAFLNDIDPGILAIFGPSGSGKSAMIAEAVRQARERFGDAAIVARFVAATPPSVDLGLLLGGVVAEVQRRHTSAPPSHIAAPELGEGADDLNVRIAAFHDLLRTRPANEPLCIFFDGLDQLSPDDGALECNWLPKKLAAHVRLVLTVATPLGEEDIADSGHLGSTRAPNAAVDPGEVVLAALARQSPFVRQLRMPPLAPADGLNLARSWLADDGRKLQPAQEAAILASFAQHGSPLWLRVAVMESERLASWDPTPDFDSDLSALLRRVFFRLSSGSEHGPVLVNRTLGYLASSRAGLAEDEVIDALSAAEDVMEEFRKRSPNSPPVDSLPVAVWVRLHGDLAPYLAERQHHGAVLMHFFHRAVLEAVEETYLNTERTRRNAHERLANYFRRIVSSDGGQDWEIHARPLAELPFHLAHAARNAELEQIFAQLAFLAARVATGQVFEQIADYALVEKPLPAALAQWRAFLQMHAQKLLDHPGMLVALANHEGFADAKCQAGETHWRQPWLRTSPESLPQGKPLPAEDLRAEISGSFPFSGPGLSTCAVEKPIGFLFDRLGTVNVVDLGAMRRTNVRLRIRPDRPLVMACAPDASSLIVFFESGVAELHRCEIDANGSPVDSALVLECSFHLPEFEDPVVAWHRDAFWFQATTGSLAAVAVDAARHVEERLPIAQHGELSALVFVGDQRLIGMRQGRNVSLFTRKSAPLPRRSAEIAAACACGDSTAAVAFTDGALLVLDLDRSLNVTAETRIGALDGSIGWDGVQLLWKEAYGGALMSWRPGQPSPLRVHDSQVLFPEGFEAIPCQWIPQLDGSILLAHTSAFVLFEIVAGGQASNGHIVELMGGAKWQAIRKRGGDQWLLQKGQPHEWLFAQHSDDQFYCGVDAKRQLFAASGSGKGMWLNLDAPVVKTTENLPPAICGAAGDTAEDGEGCWFVDRDGHLFHVDTKGIQLPYVNINLPGISGSKINNCKMHLLWTGYSDHRFSETGNEPARTFLFFRKSLGQSPYLVRENAHFKNPREGVCLFVCHHMESDTLVTLWAMESSTRAYQLRTGPTREFSEWRTIDVTVKGLPESNPRQAALSPDGRFLAIINAAGGVSLVSVAHGAVIATLVGSKPFTRLAPGASGSQFWITEAYSLLYNIELVEKY